MKPQLDKRIAGYSALAAAMLTGAQGKAKVLKYSSDAMLNGGGDFVNIDFDQVGGDGNDIMISCTTGFTGAIFYAHHFDFASSGAFLGNMAGSSIMFPFAMDASNSVPVTGAWNLNTYNTYAQGTLNVFSGYAGHWNNKFNKYMGVRFDISGSIHYGWVKMSCNGTALTVHEFAYETVANTGIDAPLPVKLSSFTAEPVDGGINITWTTQSEEDNLGFILDRRLDTEIEWTTIANYKTHEKFKGQGNSTTTSNYSFNDNDVYAGMTYFYRLSDVDVNGNSNFSRELQVEATNIVVPNETELVSAYPNPFNPGTTIQYTLESDDYVTLSVIDITGRTIRTLVKENQQAGNYSFAWDGMDNTGQPTPTGIYMLVLRAGQLTRTHKVTRIR